MIKQLKKFARFTIQTAAEVPLLHRLRGMILTSETVFTNACRRRSWGSRESVSGTGSELRATEELRKKLPEILARYGVRRMLDAPCGDWNWMQNVALPVDMYYGVDIVHDIVASNARRHGSEKRIFTQGDITRDPLPQVELVLCRDCLVHLSFSDIGTVLKNFRKTGATYLMVNTYESVRRNRNWFSMTTFRKLNMRLAPFNFPPPIESFPDGGRVDPNTMGLWRFADLPDDKL